MRVQVMTLWCASEMFAYQIALATAGLIVEDMRDPAPFFGYYPVYHTPDNGSVSGMDKAEFIREAPVFYALETAMSDRLMS
jgi:hypothetical protein